jgi:hypothetical protein
MIWDHGGYPSEEQYFKEETEYTQEGNDQSQYSLRRIYFPWFLYVRIYPHNVYQDLGMKKKLMPSWPAKSTRRPLSNIRAA